MKHTTAIILLALVITASSCKIIVQDEIGVRRKLGRLDTTVIDPGAKFFNPFLSKIITLKVRTVNIEMNLGLPSKEGLTVNSEISILYRIRREAVPLILVETGIQFEEVLIKPIFRSAAADICAKFEAKDMHSNKRSIIESEIKSRMMELLESRGFIIEQVLMKSIVLPAGLAKSIEEKMQAEQDAQRMEFAKEKERREAERKLIQAEGDKNSRIVAAEAQKRILELEAEGRANATLREAEAQAKANDMLNRSLNNMVLRNKQIEAFQNLSRSNNSKVIITDGKTPLLGLEP
ncbi:MAG: SPFH domain-containing protein [Bacteroidia bacterium]|jgi:regulator of protease activity HflC (stomatin/prohibitin superfamily)|nr:SPFH domain-containing protein [Bacteroidia bacterium]